MIPDIASQGKMGDRQDGRWLPLLIIGAIIILVGVASFGLGRLSALKESKTSLVIYPAPTGE